MTVRFADLSPVPPSAGSLGAAFTRVNERLTSGDRAAGIAAWDALRREFTTWANYVRTRFHQDTTDSWAKSARDMADTLEPVFQGHDTEVKQRLLADPDRAGLEAACGTHAVRLWEADVTTFDPAIGADMEAVSKLGSRYTELTASARFALDGETVNLSGLTPFAESKDRATRYRATRAVWEWFAENGAELDDIFDRQVKLRHGMARTLGFDSFTSLRYRQMRRIDYGPAEVARYRDEIAACVTPLMARLLERRRAVFGWNKVYAWDEPLIDPAGNPAPLGDHDTLVAAGQTMFDRMDARLGNVFRDMNEGGWLDLKTRPSKAPGGFCQVFPTEPLPFIFANFNGTNYDIGVFTHEMGHAIQVHESRGQPMADYLFPTLEACEINSMALELLAYPHIGLLVGDAAADRFVRMHLTTFLAQMLRSATNDEYQHAVYANPDASPADRHAMFRAAERRFMPWRDYGDIAYAAKGGSWQRVLHLYRMPFYMIDYALATCCALQFWLQAKQDRGAAMDGYMKLAARGGSMPFCGLTASAGLKSPFTPGVLSSVMAEAELVLAT